jgi:hypothetical protein
MMMIDGDDSFPSQSYTKSTTIRLRLIFLILKLEERKKGRGVKVAINVYFSGLSSNEREKKRRSYD